MKTIFTLAAIVGFALSAQAQQFDARTVIAFEPTLDLNGVQAIDMDQDGDQDFIGLALSEISWYENLDGLGSFGPRQDIDLTNSPRSWHVADMNGDGMEDLLVGDRDNDKVLFYANTGGALAAPVTVATPDGPLSVHSGDLNNDGFEDLIFGAYKQIGYVTGDNAGNFSGPVIVLTEPFYEDFNGIKAADLNGDGLLDLVYGRENDDKVAYMFNSGAGTFGSEQRMDGNLQAVEQIEIIDADGDGDLDVFGASNYVGGRVSWYRNLGGGNFGFRENITNSADGPEGLNIGDVDGDGDPDVVVGAYYNDDIIWFENFGSSFSSTKNYIHDEFEHRVLDVELVDINGDGFLDVLASRFILFADDEYIWFPNVANNTCETTLTPASPTATFGASSVTLSWDPVPQSVGCQINATRTSPAGFSTTKRFPGFELGSVNVSFSVLGNGTSWNWRVQCACTTSPLVLTNYSATTSFAVPAPRISAEIQLGPNPASDYIQINSTLSDQVAIYNVTGELMFSGQVNGPTQVDVSNWTSGIYLVQFEENSDANQMLVVE